MSVLMPFSMHTFVSIPPPPPPSLPCYQKYLTYPSPKPMNKLTVKKSRNPRTWWGNDTTLWAYPMKLGLKFTFKVS